MAWAVSSALSSDRLVAPPSILPSTFVGWNMAECDCLPPPQFDLPAPPDPSLIWRLDAVAQLQLEQLAVECEADDFVSILPVDLVPRLGTAPPSLSDNDGVFGEYFAFVATAVAVMLIATLVAVLIVLRLKRENNRGTSTSPQKHSRLAPMTPKSTSSGSSGGSTGADLVRGPNPLGSTNWSYNSMRPVPTHDKPQLQQASSLGMLMYGGVEQPAVCVYPAPLSSRTLPKKPRQLPMTVSIPARLQRPPAPLRINDSDDDQEHTYCSASVANRVYEEIPARRVSGERDTVFVELTTPRQPLPSHRRPPPVHRPPPPPVPDESGPESPCSCQSLSHCSSSIDGELEHIHLTPSPKRGVSSDDNVSSSHAAAYGKSSGPSEENFCTSDAPPNGRESGYGTDGRPSRLWDSPGGQARTRKQMLVRDERKPPPTLAVYGQQYQNGHAMTYV